MGKIAQSCDFKAMFFVRIIENTGGSDGMIDFLIIS